MKLVPQDTKLPILEVRIDGADSNCDDSTFLQHNKLFPQKNIRGLFVGSSASGKTSALLCLIYSPDAVSFKNIYIFSKSLYQPKYQELEAVLKTVPEIGFFTFDNSEAVPPINDVKPFSLMIFDDISSKANKNQHLRAYFSMGRHKDIDSFLLCQTYSSIPKQLIRDNANLILLFC